MDPLSISASIVALVQLTGTVIEYLHGVKGASEDHQNILSELTSVSGMLFILQDHADQQGDSWSLTLKSLNGSEGPLAQLRTSLELLVSKLAPVKGLKKVGKAFAWPFQKEEIREILNTIERQKALLNLARQNDHIALSEAMKDDVVEINHKVNDISNSIAYLQIRASIDRIQKWLEGPDPSTNYNKALKGRHPNTGNWFIESSAFVDWKANGRSFLWLYGIPGCGKTMLSATVVDKVLNREPFNPSSAVLYFYFDFNDSSKQKHEKMIRSLLSQTLRYCVDVPQELESLYSSCMDGGWQPTCEALLEALHQTMASFEETFVILDALDECTDQSELLADIEIIVGWEDIDLHLLVTSRREQVIEESLDSLIGDQASVCIDSAVISADIRVYVHYRLRADRKLKRWQKDLEVSQEIKDTIVDKADGMFRWAACQLDSLASCLNKSQLRAALKSLPKTLDDTYARILCGIDEKYSLDALKILQWLTFSARPLHLKELAEVVAIDANENPYFDTDRRLLDPRDILTMCGSLVTIGNDTSESSHELGSDEKDRTFDENSNTTDVRLAHFSVQEYLVAERIRFGPAKSYSIRDTDSNEAIAEHCLAYVLHAIRHSKTLGQTFEEFPLVRYAASFWTLHARMAEYDHTSRISQLSMDFFLADGAVFISCIGIDQDDTDPQSNKTFILAPEETKINNINLADFTGMDLCEASSNFILPLYYASLRGLPVSVKMLIEKGANVNAQGGHCGNALQAASYKGFEDVVQILLNNNADVNALGGKYLHALQAASVAGHEMIIQMLLDKGADINIQGGEHGTALQAAAYWGREDVVQILLRRGANVNAPTSTICSFSWHDATCNGLDGVCASDVRLTNGRHGSALQAAACHGKEQIVKVLLANGADVNAKGGEYGNALQAASYWGHDGIIRMLLAHETNIDFEEMSIVLWDACYNGDEKIVAIVLNEWADGGKEPEDRDRVIRNLLRNRRSGASFDMLLQWAIKTCHERVLQILTEVQTEQEDWDQQGLENSDSNSETTGDSVKNWDLYPLPEEDHASIQEQDLGPVRMEGREREPVESLDRVENLEAEDLKPI